MRFGRLFKHGAQGLIRGTYKSRNKSERERPLFPTLLWMHPAIVVRKYDNFVAWNRN
jgi:hypothetical protein